MLKKFYLTVGYGGGFAFVLFSRPRVPRMYESERIMFVRMARLVRLNVLTTIVSTYKHTHMSSPYSHPIMLFWESNTHCHTKMNEMLSLRQIFASSEEFLRETDSQSFDSIIINIRISRMIELSFIHSDSLTLACITMMMAYCFSEQELNIFRRISFIWNYIPSTLSTYKWRATHHITIVQIESTHTCNNKFIDSGVFGKWWNENKKLY